MAVVRLDTFRALALATGFAFSAWGPMGVGHSSAAAPPEATEPPPIDGSLMTEAGPSIPAAPGSSFDTETLAAAFEAAGYEPPPGSFVLVGREMDDAPTHFDWYSLGDTGVVPSTERYWPASTIKVFTAVAALEVLNAHGLTSSATLTFEDPDGPYHGPAAQIIRRAIQISSNTAYNRTVLIAGMQNINERIFPRWGLRHTIMQRRYTRPEGVEDVSLRHSPEIAFHQGRRSGTIPERNAPHLYADCPEAGNCTSLYELLLVMRRITLHHELPEEERFAISDEDVEVVHDALHESYSRIAAGAEAALGPVDVLNKTGTVPGDDALDHGLITDLTTGRRYLLAVSTRWHRARTARIGELSRQTLLAVR
jgi:hypothetical protein